MRNSISFVRKYILNLITCLFVISFTILTPVKVFANDNGHETEEKFDAGELIFDHILDSYDWHICTWKGNHISVYLPIIVYSEGEFYCFSSKNFHHEHQYHAMNKHGDAVVFEIAEDGKYKGKVVRVLEDGTQIRPLDISITKTVCGLFISCTLLVVVFLLVAKGYRERGEKAPKGIQALVEPIILYVRDDIAKPNIGEHYERYFPYLLTVFFFIFFNNLLGLIPFFPFGVNITGNIAVTAVLALFTFVITNFMGSKHYYEDIFNTPGVPWWLKFPLPLMRMADLYLLRAECELEANGMANANKIYADLNKVRARAGLPNIEDVWSNANIVNTVNKHKDEAGLRDIIHTERMIELMFEGHQYFDVRRWKRGVELFNDAIEGFNAPDGTAAETFNQVITWQPRIFQSPKHYLNPIPQEELDRNPAIDQNPGY